MKLNEMSDEQFKEFLLDVVNYPVPQGQGSLMHYLGKTKLQYLDSNSARGTINTKKRYKDEPLPK